MGNNQIAFRLRVISMAAGILTTVALSPSAASVILHRGQCRVAVNGRGADLEPHGAVLIGNRLFVSARVFTYMGATYRLAGSRELLLTDADGNTRATPARMVERRLASATIAYPYLPIRATAEMLGWRVDWSASWDRHAASGRAKVHLIALERELPRLTGSSPTWDELFSQRAEGETTFDDGLTVRLSSRIDTSRPREQRYVCQVSALLSNQGTRPIHSGNYALFAEDAEGTVLGVESMAQSMADWPWGMVSSTGILSTDGGDQLYGLFVFRPPHSLRRLIYSDGIRCFAVPVTMTGAPPPVPTPAPAQ